MNEGFGSRKGETGKYKQRAYAFDPAFLERIDKLHLLTESLIGLHLRQMDFMTVMVLCTEEYLLTETHKLKLERECKLPPSVQTDARVRSVREAIDKWIQEGKSEAAKDNEEMVQMFRKFLNAGGGKSVQPTVSTDKPQSE